MIKTINLFVVMLLLTSCFGNVEVDLGESSPVYQNESSAQEVNVRIYTKRTCPYCINAKKLLDKKGIVYEEIDSIANKMQMRKETNNARTVPQVIIDGMLIGGYDELKKLSNNGKLDVLLGKKN